MERFRGAAIPEKNVVRNKKCNRRKGEPVGKASESPASENNTTPGQKKLKAILHRQVKRKLVGARLGEFQLWESEPLGGGEGG